MSASELFTQLRDAWGTLDLSCMDGSNGWECDQREVLCPVCEIDNWFAQCAVYFDDDQFMTGREGAAREELEQLIASEAAIRREVIIDLQSHRCGTYQNGLAEAIDVIEESLLNGLISRSPIDLFNAAIESVALCRLCDTGGDK